MTETILYDARGKPIHEDERPKLSDPERRLALWGIGTTLFGGGLGAIVSLLPIAGFQIPFFVVVLLGILSGLSLCGGLAVIGFLIFSHTTGLNLKAVLRQRTVWLAGVMLAIIAGLFVWQVIQNNQLRVQLSAMRPRELSRQEKTDLQKALASGPDISSKILIIAYPDCFECRAYAWDFASAMNDIREWAFHRVGVLPYAGPGQLSTDWRGVIIFSKEPKHLNPYQAALVAALQAAHIAFSFEPGSYSIDKAGYEGVALLIAPQHR